MKIITTFIAVIALTLAVVPAQASGGTILPNAAATAQSLTFIGDTSCHDHSIWEGEDVPATHMRYVTTEVVGMHLDRTCGEIWVGNQLVEVRAIITITSHFNGTEATKIVVVNRCDITQRNCWFDTTIRPEN